MTPREWLLTRARGSQGVLATSTGCMQLVCRIIVVRLVRTLAAKSRACKNQKLENTTKPRTFTIFARSRRAGRDEISMKFGAMKNPMSFTKCCKLHMNRTVLPTKTAMKCSMKFR